MALGGDLVGPRGYFKTPTPWAPVPTPLGTGGQKGWKTTHLPSHFWVVVQRSNVSKIGMKIVFGPKKIFEKFLECRNWRRDHNSFSKVSHFFSCFFFKRAFFRQFAADPGPISVKNFLLVWIFQKCPKKVGKMHLRHLQPSRPVWDLSASHFGSVAPIGVIFGLKPPFRPKFFSPKISSISDQWLTRGGCF